MSKYPKEYNEDIGCNMVENIIYIYIYIYIFESKGASWAIGKYIRLGDIGKAKKNLSLGQQGTLKNTLKRVGMLGWSSRVVEGAKNVNVFN
jgi:hypothetical protein